MLFDDRDPLDLDAAVRTFLAVESETRYGTGRDTKSGSFYRLFGSNDVMTTVKKVERQATWRTAAKNHWRKVA